MNKTVVINVVGLTHRLIGAHTPRIRDAASGKTIRKIDPVIPAVTCTAQATYLTGKLPKDHGIVGNGWYFREEREVKFWRQSNDLVKGPKLWDELKAIDPGFTTANLFWWYNMYSSADYSVTPRPNYLADGRKIPDIYSNPPELRDYLQDTLGTFPLFHFWGPKTSVKSSQWIADAAILTDKKFNPTLSLVYLPHLDYNLQRYGNDLTKIARDLQEVDAVVGELLDYYNSRDARIVLLSEYGITPVNNPVHLNRVLREAGWLHIREERGLELLDAGASAAFAVADHQVAHVYVKIPGDKEQIRDLLLKVEGVSQVWGASEIAENGLDHERCGDFVVLADTDSWFTYYYWLDDAKAPDFARTVDIHKKPGYDPVEMFTDPSDPWVYPKIILKLLAKKLGFRTLMDVIPLNASLVKGSHGTKPEDPMDYPVMICGDEIGGDQNPVRATEVYSILKEIITT